nr:response regulator [uncultured Noviherbaspirillum sp.]
MQQFSNATKCRVLVVEDDRPQRNLFVEVLDEEHMDVVAVSSSEEAFEILQTASIVSLLVTDILLEGQTNGLELAAYARRIHPNIKIMFVTGYPQGTDISKKAAKMGNTIMFKPFKLREFARQVNTILEKLPCYQAWLAATVVKQCA